MDLPSRAESAAETISQTPLRFVVADISGACPTCAWDPVRDRAPAPIGFTMHLLDPEDDEPILAGVWHDHAAATAAGARP